MDMDLVNYTSMSIGGEMYSPHDNLGFRDVGTIR